MSRYNETHTLSLFLSFFLSSYTCILSYLPVCFDCCLLFVATVAVDVVGNTDFHDANCHTGNGLCCVVLSCVCVLCFVLDCLDLELLIFLFHFPPYFSRFSFCCFHLMAFSFLFFSSLLTTTKLLR